MTKKALFALCGLLCVNFSWAAQHDSEKNINVDGKTRKYVLYVPDNVLDPAPLVFSLHGASGHDTDRSPFRTSVADSEGCIVVYPQGNDQYFPVFGGSIPGWNSTGFDNEDVDFFKAIITDVEANYSIDRNRVYCCGFSNGGMMTYANASAASDVFAAFASISGFQLNEFHLRTIGARPVPFLHIHGKADDFVKYSCMPIIRDGMIARNGCNPVPEVSEVAGKYRKSVYAATEGGFPYVYYEVDDMWHNDYTDRTDDGNSALTMWRFMSQYTLDADCDTTLKWRLNIDTPDFSPKAHQWKVSSAKKKFEYGKPKKADNADNNVYPSLQFDAGKYELWLSTQGNADNYVYVEISQLESGDVLLCKRCKIGADAKISIDVPEYDEFKLTILKEDADDVFTMFEIHASESPSDVNCEDADLTGISDACGETEASAMGYVNLNGIEAAHPNAGINIVRLSDGSVVKVLHR